MKKKAPLIGKILLKAVSVLVAAVVLVFLYITLIVAQPQEAPAKEKVSLPLMNASQARVANNEQELYDLVAAFPVPVMSFMSGSGMVFVSGTSSDTAFNGGFARLVTLYWQTPEGQPLILQSWYPGDLSLMGKGNYAFSSVAGPVLFGTSSVRMENGDTVRIHTLTEDGLYAVTVPKALSSSLSALTRSIQLFTAGEEPAG